MVSSIFKFGMGRNEKTMSTISGDRTPKYANPKPRIQPGEMFLFQGG